MMEITRYNVIDMLDKFYEFGRIGNNELLTMFPLIDEEVSVILDDLMAILKLGISPVLGDDPKKVLRRIYPDIKTIYYSVMVYLLEMGYRKELFEKEKWGSSQIYKFNNKKLLVHFRSFNSHKKIVEKLKELYFRGEVVQEMPILSLDNILNDDPIFS